MQLLKKRGWQATSNAQTTGVENLIKNSKLMGKKVSITTKAVAWNADKPTKYQTAAEIQVSATRIIRISGYPKSTEKEAKKALKEEFSLWQEAMIKFSEVIK